MIQARGNPREARDEFVRLLVCLHDLIRQGKGDEDDADEIRDQMDVPWHQLTPSDELLVRGLSADLYTLSGDSPIRHATDPSCYSDSLKQVIAEARRANNLTEVLHLLRGRSAEIFIGTASYIRGTAYEELGLPEVAMLFFEHASKVENRLGRATAGLLWRLRRQERMTEAIEIAKKCLATDRRLAPELLVPLALTAGSVQPQHFEIIPVSTLDNVVARVMDALGSTVSSDGLRPHLGSSLLSLAVAYWARGNEHRAVTLLNDVLKILPNDPVALALRGQLIFRTDPSQAMHDFQRAVAKNTPLVAPYLRLAHDALRRGQAATCIDLCRVILQKTDRPDIRANVFEWMAIASWQQGSSAQFVRELFLKATNLAPENSRIQRNFDRFEASVFANNGHDDDWQFDDPASIDLSSVSDYANASSLVELIGS